MEARSSLKLPITAAILNLILLAVVSLDWILIFRRFGYIWGPWGYANTLILVFNMISGTALMFFLLQRKNSAVKKLITLVLISRIIHYPISFAFWLILGRDNSIKGFTNYLANAVLGFLPEYGIYLNFWTFYRILEYVVVFLLLYYLFKKPNQKFSRDSNEGKPFGMPEISSSLAQELERLQQMYNSGALTEEEFTVAKKRVLGN